MIIFLTKFKIPQKRQWEKIVILSTFKYKANHLNKHRIPCIYDFTLNPNLPNYPRNANLLKYNLWASFAICLDLLNSLFSFLLLLLFYFCCFNTNKRIQANEWILVGQQNVFLPLVFPVNCCCCNAMHDRYDDGAQSASIADMDSIWYQSWCERFFFCFWFSYTHVCGVDGVKLSQNLCLLPCHAMAVIYSSDFLFITSDSVKYRFWP